VATSILDERSSVTNNDNMYTETNPYLVTLTQSELSWFHRSTNAAMSSSILPVVSAALLITGNTVGAGCLVLPEVAVGPGLAAVTCMLAVAWGLNLVSGLVLAEVAIVQYEQKRSLGHSSRTSDTMEPPTDIHDEDEDMDDVPTSFQDFAAANLNSPLAATAVSALSLFVNACVAAFDFGRMGIVLSSLSDGLLVPNHSGEQQVLAVVWAAAVATALATLSNKHITVVCNVCVAALFVSFGSLLIPGLAHVAQHTEAASTLWSMASLSSAFSLDSSGATATAAAAQAFPIVLMSLVYQNIVPVVVKLLHYQRGPTVAALSLGSAIPMLMYTAWCYASLGGGIDGGLGSSGGDSSSLWTVFSMATLGASSLCTGLSMTEEVGTFWTSSASPPPPVHSSTAPPRSSFQPVTTESPVSIGTAAASPGLSKSSAALLAVSVPLVAALVFGDTEHGLTGALSLAGSFGSPILYGAIPALMAYRQRQALIAPSLLQPRPLSTPQPQHLVSSSALPVLGLLSTAFVGQEAMARLGALFA
jgi:amino acid permease